RRLDDCCVSDHEDFRMEVSTRVNLDTAVDQPDDLGRVRQTGPNCPGVKSDDEQTSTSQRQELEAASTEIRHGDLSLSPTSHGRQSAPELAGEKLCPHTRTPHVLLLAPSCGPRSQSHAQRMQAS